MCATCGCSPTRPGTSHDLAPRTRASPRTRSRAGSLAVDDDPHRCRRSEPPRPWTASSSDVLARDEVGRVAGWSWAASELTPPPAGTQYTELLVDLAGVRRTVVARSPAAIALAAERLARGWRPCRIPASTPTRRRPGRTAGSARSAPRAW